MSIRRSQQESLVRGEWVRPPWGWAFSMMSHGFFPLVGAWLIGFALSQGGAGGLPRGLRWASPPLVIGGLCLVVVVPSLLLRQWATRVQLGADAFGYRNWRGRVLRLPYSDIATMTWRESAGGTGLRIRAGHGTDGGALAWAAGFHDFWDSGFRLAVKEELVRRAGLVVAAHVRRRIPGSRGYEEVVTYGRPEDHPT